jgi:hypothetical protein
MTTLIAGGGAPGWAVLGAVFITAGAMTIPVTRWALRTRADDDHAREAIAAVGDVA